MSPKKKDEKVELLLLIRDHYHILNGRHSPILTQENKKRAWMAIFDDCQAKGHAWTIDRDWTFLQKTKWPSIKRDVTVGL
jgi:hypothetical protein